MKKKISIMALMVLVCFFSQAEKQAKSIRKGDSRLREIIYDPDEVTRINTYYGISTAIVFHKDETILLAGVGDKEAWELEASKNMLLIRPVAEQPYSNLTIQTNLHLYHFLLDTLPIDQDIENAPFRVSFKYPTYEVEKKKIAAKKRQEIAKERHIKAKKAKINGPIQKVFDPAKHFRKNPDIVNVDYFYQGHYTLKPSFLYDDGVHTYLRMLKAQANPAIYAVLSDNKESLVNRSSTGDWIIIQGIYKELRLRVGDSVLAVVNDNYNPLNYKRPAIKAKEKRFIKETQQEIN